MTRRQAPWSQVYAQAQAHGLDAGTVRFLRRVQWRSHAVHLLEPGLGVMALASLTLLATGQAAPALVFAVLLAVLAGAWGYAVWADARDIRAFERFAECRLGQSDPHGLVDFRRWPGWRVRTAPQWLSAVLWVRRYGASQA